jgi:hypothetical protein
MIPTSGYGNLESRWKTDNDLEREAERYQNGVPLPRVNVYTNPPFTLEEGARGRRRKIRGVTLSRDLLLKEVWPYSSEVFTRTVDVHVASLRQKSRTIRNAQS